MLLLTCRLGEAINIGDDISIVIVDAESNRCQLGVDAPKTIKVMRGELVESDAMIERLEQRHA
tara:strand:- start:18026 stop:18214 length:189 start_codon:yes stop_codon:yes gene_type:complete